MCMCDLTTQVYIVTSRLDITSTSTHLEAAYNLFFFFSLFFSFLFLFFSFLLARLTHRAWFATPSPSQSRCNLRHASRLFFLSQWTWRFFPLLLLLLFLSTFSFDSGKTIDSVFALHSTQLDFSSIDLTWVEWTLAITFLFSPFYSTASFASVSSSHWYFHCAGGN